MKNSLLPLGLTVCMAFLPASCIKSELPGDECDIEQVVLHLTDPSALFFDIADTLYTVKSTESTITFRTRRSADLSALAPEFILSEGASVSPESGAAQDFSSPVEYTVTSEDGKWQKKYTVQFVPATVMIESTLHLDFEHRRLENNAYYVWYEEDDEGHELDWWASANLGFGLTGGARTPEDYPTYPVTEGYEGAGLGLTTRPTGFFGALMGKYIAPGSLFIGEFDLQAVVEDPLASTVFGIPFGRKPLKLNGYYKYTPGDVMVDKDNNPIEGRSDEGSIYAVLFRNKDGEEKITLTGADLLTSPYICGKARMTIAEKTEKWTPFSLSMEYLKEIDLDVLKDLGYSLTIVFSSSADGDNFVGAIGSTLMVDQVELLCEEEAI